MDNKSEQHFLTGQGPFALSWSLLISDVQRGAGGGRLLERMHDWNGAPNLANCTGYDYLDELINGVLQFEEPSAGSVQLPRTGSDVSSE